MIGTTLAHYKVTAALGVGGMGEVWRAEDEKLGREVALKVLPTEFAQDPERLARFEREAKVLASLNHPNIAHLYGLESVHTRADGPKRSRASDSGAGSRLQNRLNLPRDGAGGGGGPRRDRIARGPMPVDEAIPIALQIAEALEAAHERASSTATSSLPTSRSARTARSRCSTSGSPRRGRRRRRLRACRCRRP